MPIPVSDLMMKCWENDPKERPDFSHLDTKLGNMVEDDVHSHFLRMMDRPYYIETNSQMEPVEPITE